MCRCLVNRHILGILGTLLTASLDSTCLQHKQGVCPFHCMHRSVCELLDLVASLCSCQIIVYSVNSQS